MEKKEVISFRKPIDPGHSGKISERVKGPGTVESFKVRFYAGQSEDLQIKVYIKRVGNIIEDLITFKGNDYLSGDDDYFIYDVIAPVRNDDEIVVEYKNITVEDTPGEIGPYTLSVDVAIDYYMNDRRF